MRLSALHQHVFRLRYRYKLTLDQTFESLRPRFPGLTLAAVAAADTRIGTTLSGRHTRALLRDQPRFEPLDTTDSGVPDGLTAADTGPNPEDVALVREQRHLLRSAIADLDADDRLMVALRFEEGLTLAAVARMAGLRDAQQADRRLRRILGRLRSALG
jgi:RNA polymerase sigma factor (sigma-70 family)